MGKEHGLWCNPIPRELVRKCRVVKLCAAGTEFNPRHFQTSFQGMGFHHQAMFLALLARLGSIIGLCGLVFLVLAFLLVLGKFALLS